MTKSASKKQWSPAELGAIFNKNFAALVEVLDPHKDQVLATSIVVDKETNKPQILVFVDKASKEDLKLPETVGTAKVSVKVLGMQRP